jgi:hypothetical protein
VRLLLEGALGLNGQLCRHDSGFARVMRCYD